MAASVEEDFESWLSLKLKALNTDEGVFGSYITGILEGEESIDEKTEALEGILSEITDLELGWLQDNDISQHCHEILAKWRASHDQDSKSPENNVPKEKVEEKLVRLMETNAPSTTVQRQYTEEERKIREAILAQYSQTSDQESVSDEEQDDCGDNMMKNRNVTSVMQAEKEKREKAKVESQKKKEKDREDRERQKQQQQEKKEKRKTQKGERRR